MQVKVGLVDCRYGVSYPTIIIKVVTLEGEVESWVQINIVWDSFKDEDI